VVLVGTAGIIETDASLCGKVYMIERAYAGATGVGYIDRAEPKEKSSSFQLGQVEDGWWRSGRSALSRYGQSHHWPGINLPVERGESVSSDYYYGSSLNWPDRRVASVQDLDSKLAQAMNFTWKAGRLLDMVVEPFYLLARAYGPPELKYVAIKGVSNLHDGHAAQIDLTQPILAEVLRLAANLLGVSKTEPASPVAE
ncbi:MAG: hypothetical protein ACRD3W_13910, partial [Terriglobales bacterium]